MKKLTDKNSKHQKDPTGKAGTLYIIKISGNIVDDDVKLSSFLISFASISDRKILVHGGGKLATNLAERLGIPQTMIDGRRITDNETLKIVTMVYAGYINKNIVAKLQAANCNAIGITGADANLILAKKRNHPSIDFGFAGDIESKEFSVSVWQLLLDNKLTPVVAPITHDKKGQLLNTNADTIAQEIAKGLSSAYNVNLIYLFERTGVLTDVNNDRSVISCIDQKSYNDLKSKQLIFSGMIPKLDNAFEALKSGVKKVIIGKAEQLHDLIAGTSGTTVIND